MKTAIALIVITGLFPNAYGTLTVNPLWEKSGAKLALNQVTIEECADRLVAHYKQNSLLFSNLTNEIFKYNLPPDSMNVAKQ